MKYNPDLELIRWYFYNREWLGIIMDAGAGVKDELIDLKYQKGPYFPSSSTQFNVRFLQENNPIIAKLLSKYKIPVSQLDNFGFIALICHNVFDLDHHLDWSQDLERKQNHNEKNLLNALREKRRFKSIIFRFSGKQDVENDPDLKVEIDSNSWLGEVADLVRKKIWDRLEDVEKQFPKRTKKESRRNLRKITDCLRNYLVGMELLQTKKASLKFIFEFFSELGYPFKYAQSGKIIPYFDEDYLKKFLK